MTRTRAHLFISGLVQGVFFRDSLRREALQTGVTGWVRNRMDGRVEALMEGEQEEIQRLVEWCKIGPPAAEVDNVEVKFAAPTGEYDRFLVVP
jgi:acylphosphatase